MAVRPWPAPVSVSDVAAAGDWAGDWLLQLGPEETPATGLRPYHISSPLTSICANVEILPLHHPSRTYLFIYSSVHLHHHTALLTYWGRKLARLPESRAELKILYSLPQTINLL